MEHKLKITFNAPVTLCFVGICIVVQVVAIITSGKSSYILFTTYHSSLLSPLTFIRLFMHVLGHSGWEHLINNMMFVLLLGPMLEEKYGSKILVSVMCIVAFSTGIVNYLLFPTTALCGASGICFAFILMSSFTKSKIGEIPVTFILVAVAFLGQQVYLGIAANDEISNFSHIIGGLIGGLSAYLINKMNVKPR